MGYDIIEYLDWCKKQRHDIHLTKPPEPGEPAEPFVCFLYCDKPYLPHHLRKNLETFRGGHYFYGKDYWVTRRKRTEDDNPLQKLSHFPYNGNVKEYYEVSTFDANSGHTPGYGNKTQVGKDWGVKLCDCQPSIDFNEVDR